MSEKNGKSSVKSGGIGLWGLLTIIFVILKLNPGGYLTTQVVEWPWFRFWGLSVFCPIWFPFLFVCGILVVLGIIVLIAAYLDQKQ